MRRILKLSVLCLAAGVVTACRPDEIIETQAIPTAGVRFINAVPDTGAMDFRFVDIVENNVQWLITFRNTPVITPTGANGVPGASFVQYKPAQAGSRHFRIFMNPLCSPVSCNTALAAQAPIKDTTVTLTAGNLYTAIMWGYANPAGAGRPAGAPAMALRWIEENIADPGTQVGVRVINATMGPLDVWHYADGGAPAAAPEWDAVPGLPAAGAVTAHLTAAPGIRWYQVRDDGGAVDLFADRRALIGTAEVLGPPGPFDATPGTSVAGSAVTGIVFPASVVGTAAPQGAGSATVPAWTAPAIVFVWDRRPPRSAGI
jgi:hypothetical protein